MAKLRSQKFTWAKAISNSLDPRQPAFDETRGLVVFIGFMHLDPEAFDQTANIFLREDKVNQLKQKFPRSNYQSTSEWAKAVIEELQSFLTPTVNFDALAFDNQVGDFIEALRESKEYSQVFLTAIHASEFLEHDLDQRERLDARIARLIKTLIQMKAMKQMLRQTSTGAEDNQSRKIPPGSKSKG